MRAIKHALTERYYTWQDALDVAVSDPEINLNGEDGEAYMPSQYEDDLETEDGWAHAEDAVAAPGAAETSEQEGGGTTGESKEIRH